MTAEGRRRAAHLHDDNGAGEMTCGSCGRSWCFTCHPTPAALCPWENGDNVNYPRPSAIRLRRGGAS